MSVATTAVSPRPASGPLETGIFDPFTFPSDDRDLAFQRTKNAGASTVVLNLSWRNVVHGGATKPAGFDASNPSDPNYRWARFDAEVRSAVAHGLQPVALVSEPPDWAAGQGSMGITNQAPPS